MSVRFAPIADEAGPSTVLVYLIAGFILTFILWASFTELDEVTRGDGKIIPAQKTQIIQSSEAGIVSELFVRLGQRISKGDLLMRLDKTSTAANVGEVEAKIRSLSAQVARLTSEHEGKLDGQFPCPAAVQAKAPGVCSSEQKLFEARAASLQSKIKGAEEKASQKRLEIAETAANIARLTDALKSARQELAMLEPLATRKVVSDVEILRARRAVTDFDGQLKTAVETKARAEAGLREAELGVADQHLLFRQAALAELTEKQAELSVVEETVRGANERLRRTDIRSPVDGIVNEVIVNTQGAFVNPGDRVLSIVPVDDTLLVEAHIKPSDIAFIHPSQKAIVKITAFDFSIFGGLEGVVENVSADTILDPVTKDPFYTVIVRTSNTTLKSTRGENEIIPGMICNVDIMTGRKSIMQYLLKPINKAREQALRER